MSAGTLPAATMNRVVVDAMREIGIDLSVNIPKMLTIKMVEDADLVVTMGCSVEEVCPTPIIAKMHKKLVDWNLEDPRGKPIERVRQIRDEIERKVAEL